MPLPPEPIVIPTSLTYRSALGRVLPLSNLELDGNMAYLEKLAEERLPISDFTGQKIIDLINQTDNSGIDAASLSSFRAYIEPNINSIPVRDNNGVIFASGVTAENFYGKADTAGDADTAKKLKTPVKINTVNFDGTADITIADSTKLPLAGGTLTGKVTLSPASALASGIRITPGTAPNSPVNGDVWITNAGQLNQIAGVTRTVAYTDSNITGTAANVTGIVAISNGGTGATTTANARTNIGAAASGANSDITSLSSLTTALSTSQGGTGLISPGQAGNILTSNGVVWQSVTPSTNAATATALQTPRAINGVYFDGTADITIADSTKLPLAGGTLTGKLTTSSGLTITPGAGPDSPVNGDIWLTDAGQYNRINGVTRTVAYTDSNITGTATNVTGIVAIGNGGTGSTYASGARANLGAAASGANSDITSLSGLTTALSVSQGGTGSTYGSGARANIGAAASGANSDITSLSGLTTALSVSQGGTGSTYASGARANIGAAASGANSDITSLSSLTTPLSVSQGGTGSTYASGARANLGAAVSGANSDITSLSGLTTALSVSQGGTGSTYASGARANLGAAVSGANSDITSLSGLTTALSVSQGGTGSTYGSGARANIGAAASGANSDITSLNNLTTALSVSQGGTGLTYAGEQGNVLMSNGTTWVSATLPSSGSSASGMAPFIGAITYFAMTAIEPGWLPCGGFAYSRTTFKELFDKIGTTYGAGDGWSTFNVPNLFDEFIRGVGTGRSIGSWQNGYGAGLAEYQTARNPPGENNDNKARSVPSDGTWSEWNVTGRSLDWDDHHIRFRNYNISDLRPRNVALLPCIFSGVTSVSAATFEVFHVMPGSDSVPEGSSISFTVTGIGSTNRSSVYWEIESITGGIIDFVNWVGTVNLTNNVGVFSVTTVSYIGTTDRQFRVKIYTNSNKSKFLSQTGVITITDTTPMITSFALAYDWYYGILYAEITGKFPKGTILYGTEVGGNGRFTITAGEANNISYRSVNVTTAFSNVYVNTVDLRINGYTGAIVKNSGKISYYSGQPDYSYQTCFPENSSVMLYDCSWKRIGDIVKTDLLMGANGVPVKIQNIDTPILGNRKMYQMEDGHTWSEEHAHWVYDEETDNEWWWSANADMWRNEVSSNTIVGLKNNDSIISHRNVKFAHISGFVSRAITEVYYPPNTKLYLPITDGTPIIVDGYVVGAGINELTFDYTKFCWEPNALRNNTND